MGGWIKIHRKILEWEWYDDPNTFKLFMHLMLTANHAPKKWRGQTIGIGQKLTSRAKLSAETKLSEQQIRTCLERLKSTNEITIQATKRQTVITLCNYDTYQSAKQDVNQPINQQNVTIATNNQPTINQATNKKDKNDKKVDTASADAEHTPCLISKKGKKLNGKRLKAFEKFWESFGYKKGKAESIDAWLEIPELLDSIVDTICKAAKIECQNRAVSIAEGRTPKMAQGWISGRRWEDESIFEQPAAKQEPRLSFQEQDEIRKQQESDKITAAAFAAAGPPQLRHG